MSSHNRLISELSFKRFRGVQTARFIFAAKKMCNSLKPRILYVDDDRDACELISLMLHLEVPGCEVTAVSTAYKALTIIKDEPIALFILDYILPEMTGVELCRLIRRTDAQTPILFYSAMVRAVDREAAMTAGATEYLIKPDDLNGFTATVRRLLQESPSMSKSASSMSREAA